MSVAGTPSGDPWVIPPRERSRYEDQFKALKPVNGVVTGEQAKGFFLQSRLEPLILGQIWALADTDADGKMDIHEFLIACKLINLKLRGYDVPKMLPPALLASVRQQAQTPPSIPPLPNPALVSAPQRPEPPKPMMSAVPQPIMTQPVASNFMPPTGIVQPMPVTSMPMQMAPVQAVVQPAPMMVAPNMAMVPGGMVPTTMPATAMVQPTAMPQAVLPQTYQQPAIPGVGVVQPLTAAPLAPITPPATSNTVTPRTSVSSLDKQMLDSLVEWAVPHPTKLKYTQIFNTTDRTRSGYLTGPQARHVMMSTKLPQNVLAEIWALSDMDSDGRLGCEEFVLAMHLCEQASLGNPPPKTLPPELIPPSFRRPVRSSSRTASISSQGSAQPGADVDLTLISQNSFEDKRKENFEKGQAELERRRKALLDQLRKETEERERKEREEAEKRERARLEAERKRAEELEKQMREQQERERLMEEERKRQAEQREAARKEMERQRQLEWEKQRLQELTQQRQREQETVLKLKAKNQSLTIELSTLGDSVKELSQKICDTRVGVSNVKATIDGMRSTRDTTMQEMSSLKTKLKEQNAKLLQLSQEKIRMEAKNKMNAQMNENAEQRQAFDNKEITIKNLKEKIEDMEKEIDSKMSDIENNNSVLGDLKGELSKLVDECENLYGVYEDKRNTIIDLKGSTKTTDYSSAWGASDDSWGAPKTEWPVEDSSSWKTEPEAAPAGSVRYRALYEFVARNKDEITFQPGDIINVPLEQTGEPGWLAGEIRGHTGWFPESYVEPVDGAGVAEAVTAPAETAPIESKPLEGIAEVPEVVPQAESIPETGDYYVACYPYQSAEQGDLIFNAGDVIEVVKKDGDWWTGKIDDRVGIFPSNYVQKADASAAGTETIKEPDQSSQQQLQEDDNEVSQINENRKDSSAQKVAAADFAALASSAQTIKSGKKPEIASVIAPYQATSNEQLSLERGQLIMIRKKNESGWWEGELQAKGRKRQVGWFPASYVKVLNSSGRVSGRTTPVSTTRMQQEVVIDKVVALYPYTASNPDELNFLKDDIISVTAREDQAWWRGELNGVSGLFPSNYVTPIQQQQFADSSTTVSGSNGQRADAIRELVDTEKAYIEDMSVVRRVFEKPLIESGVANRKELDNIFLNWHEILKCNKAFLHDLLKRQQSGSDLFGDVIFDHLPKMTAYVTFCKKQLEGASSLQNLYETSPKFREVMRKCQSNSATKGLPLSSFLIKPMQRITKYPLLIEKIVENTPDNHPDFPLLSRAFEASSKFLKCINENVRQKEDFERLQWLQENVQLNGDYNINFNGNTNKLGPRQLLHYGVLTKVKSGKELLGFLLNDFLLLVQANKASLTSSQFNFHRNSNVTYKMYKQPMMVNELQATRVSSEPMDNGTDLYRVIRLTDGKLDLSLVTNTVNECNLWLKRIELAQHMYEKAMALTRPKPKTRKATFAQKVYCKVSLGENTQNTGVAIDGRNGNQPPHSPSLGPPTQTLPSFIWNYSMQFPIRRLSDDAVLFLAVYEMCPFSPDEFLGSAEVKLKDLHAEYLSRKGGGPIVKKLILHYVESGEVTIKFDLHMFDT